MNKLTHINILRIGKSVTRKVGEKFTDRHLANENGPFQIFSDLFHTFSGLFLLFWKRFSKLSIFYFFLCEQPRLLSLPFYHLLCVMYDTIYRLRMRA